MFTDDDLSPEYLDHLVKIYKKKESYFWHLLFHALSFFRHSQMAEVC